MRILDQTITPSQIKALQTLFSKKGFGKEERAEFIHNYTNGRTSSTKELTIGEAKMLLKEFGVLSEEEKRKKIEQAKKTVGAIYFISLQIDFLNKGFSNDNEADFEMNKAKINQFCRERSAAKKPIAQMTLEELKATKKQLESIARKQNEHKPERKGNEKATTGKVS